MYFKEKVLTKNVKSEAYIKLIEYVFSQSTSFSFTIRDDVGMNSVQENLVGILGNTLMSVERTNKWGDTELLEEGSLASVYSYPTNETTKEIILSNSNSLFSWGDDRLSNLPEDLCFYYNEQAILITNGHENYAKIFFYEKDQEKKYKKKMSILNKVFKTVDND